MVEPALLEVIARKEQELRARLLAARAQADALVAAARKEAAELRSAEEAAAVAEARTWLAQELDRAERETEAAIAASTAAIAGWQADPAVQEAAVRRVVDAVLLRPGSPSQ